MAETCIVCLSTLRQHGDQLSPSASPPTDVPGDAKRSLRNTSLTSKSIEDDEIVARLIPCKHVLHNACLKPWVERANSCPTCRATFNQVELSATVDGEIIDSYTVQDKVQEVVYENNTAYEALGDDDLIDDVDFESAAPCVVCEIIDESQEVMYCDGCEATVHVFCAGFEDMPEVWYCAECHADLTRVQAQRQRNRPTRHDVRGNRAWARVWQVVSRQLDFDLDFPFREDEDRRVQQQRRDLQAWERRFRIADRQGAARRLRNMTAYLQPRPAPARPAQESEDVIRAWNAFEKARESQEDPQSRRKRPRSESPQRETGPERQLKRPRLRRPPTNTEPNNIAESSTAATQRATDTPTFLSSLLQEVEQKPVSAASPEASNGHYSPRNQSPVRSQSFSGPATPRARSPPASPPLSSTILPPLSPPGLTFTTVVPQPEALLKRQQRGRARARIDTSPATAHSHDKRAPEALSPTQHLSLATKEEIQRMVKLALGSRYRDKELTKDQYTDINRDVSRRLYELVGNAAALAEEDGRSKWQHVAEIEVQKAVAALTDTAPVLKSPPDRACSVVASQDVATPA